MEKGYCGRRQYGESRDHSEYEERRDEVPVSHYRRAWKYSCIISGIADTAMRGFELTAFFIQEIAKKNPEVVNLDLLQFLFLR